MSDFLITYHKLRRGSHLQRKMSRNHQFMNDFVKFMEKLISKGYATESTVLAEN